MAWRYLCISFALPSFYFTEALCKKPHAVASSEFLFRGHTGHHYPLSLLSSGGARVPDWSPGANVILVARLAGTTLLPPSFGAPLSGAQGQLPLPQAPWSSPRGATASLSLPSPFLSPSSFFPSHSLLPFLLIPPIPPSLLSSLSSPLKRGSGV
jgi:hypothetical protein